MGGRIEVTPDRLVFREIGYTLAGYGGAKSHINTVGQRILRSSPRWVVVGEDAMLLDEETNTALIFMAGQRRAGERVL